MVQLNHTKNLKSLIGLSAEEISELTGIKEKYRGRQIYEWLTKGVESFDDMSNIPKSVHEKLKSEFSIFSTSIEKIDSDAEGTAKIAVKLSDGLIIEAVLLKDIKERKTACISSQAGCAMGCKFCRTGMMGLKRNLSAYEIIEQYMHLRSLYGDIDNIVYMGMGEPLKNTKAVIKSLKWFTQDYGMSARRITLSTCGIISGIESLAEEAPPVRLALSLVTADPEKRRDIMPVTNSNSLANLKKALIRFQENGGRRITLECAIIKDINDKTEDALLVAEWAKGLSVNVNVIPWNPASEIDYEEPDIFDIESYCRALEKRGIPVTRRFRKGQKMNAACGQLAVNLEKKPPTR